jgi:hypothetical protein
VGSFEEFCLIYNQLKLEPHIQSALTSQASWVNHEIKRAGIHIKIALSSVKF